jgi:hypothetical protein
MVWCDVVYGYRLRNSRGEVEVDRSSCGLDKSKRDGVAGTEGPSSHMTSLDRPQRMDARAITIAIIITRTTHSCSRSTTNEPLSYHLIPQCFNLVEHLRCGRLTPHHRGQLSHQHSTVRLALECRVCPKFQWGLIRLLPVMLHFSSSHPCFR